MRHTTCLSALALFCGTVLIASNASGQMIKLMRPITATPIQSTTQSVTSFSAPKPPRLYTQMQRAAVVAQVMRLSAAPLLDTPISLTPIKPVVPDVAHAVLYDVKSVGGPAVDTGDNFASTGWAEFNPTPNAGIIIDVIRQTKTYFAVDCRTDAPHVYFSYDGGNGPVSGEATPDNNRHLVIAIPTAPLSAGQPYGPRAFHLFFSFVKQNEAAPQRPLRYWGCDISPF
jgi:hypothetical protein